MSTRGGKPYEDGITVSFKEDVVKAAQVVYPDSSFVQIARDIVATHLRRKLGREPGTFYLKIKLTPDIISVWSEVFGKFDTRYQKTRLERAVRHQFSAYVAFLRNNPELLRNPFGPLDNGEGE